MFGEGWRFQKVNNLWRDTKQWLWESGIISLSSHNGFLLTAGEQNHGKQEVVKVYLRVGFILSLLFHSLISAWSVASRLQGLWRQRIRCWCSLSGICSMIKEASISAPVTSSLLPMHPFLLSPPCSSTTHFFFTFLSLWLRDIWQKLWSFMKFKSWWGSNRNPESPFACLKDLTAGRQLDKKQPLTPALQSDFQW